MTKQNKFLCYETTGNGATIWFYVDCNETFKKVIKLRGDHWGKFEFDVDLNKQPNYVNVKIYGKNYLENIERAKLVTLRGVNKAFDKLNESRISIYDKLVWARD